MTARRMMRHVSVWLGLGLLLAGGGQIASAGLQVLDICAAAGDVLHNQCDVDGLQGANSQDFLDAGGTMDNFDTDAADDVTTPAGTGWIITRVEVDGRPQGTGAVPSSMTVNFYHNAGSQPGSFYAFTTVAAGTSGYIEDNGDFSLPVFMYLAKNRTYWLSVRANMTFNPGSRLWFWNEHDPQVGSAANWRNPGQGFAQGGVCPNWGPWAAVCNSGQGSFSDFAFRLRGFNFEPSNFLFLPIVRQQ